MISVRESRCPFRVFAYPFLLRYVSSNPQVGSGGAGSGGLVKVLTTSNNFGKVDVSGGGKPLQQNWSPA